MKRIIDELLTYDKLLRPYPLYSAMRKYFIFITGGGIGLLLSLAITALLFDVLDAPFWFSYAVSMLAAIIFTFLYHQFLTFGLRTRWKRRFANFSAVVLTIAGLNYLSVLTLTRTFPEVHYVIIIFFVTLVLSVLNFLTNRFVVFRS